jgi:hypothetical protein
VLSDSQREIRHGPHKRRPPLTISIQFVKHNNTHDCPTLIVNMSLLQKWNKLARHLPSSFHRRDKTGPDNEDATVLTHVPPPQSVGRRQSQEGSQTNHREPMPELSRSKESQQSKVSSQAFDIPRISRKFSLRRPKTEYKVNQRREPLHSGATIVPINIGIPLISLAEAQRRQGESGSSFGPSAASSVVRSNSSGTVRVSPTSPKHNLARHGLESKAIVSSDQQPTSQLRPPLSSQAFELQACSGIRLGSCGQPLQLAAVASTLLATPKKYKEPADEMKDSLFTTKKHQESDRRTVSPIPFRIALGGQC